MADWIDAAFALNGFDTNRTDAPIKLSLQFVDIVEWNEIHSGYQRHERIAILRLPGGRERAKCAPVERIFECQQTPLRLVSIAAVGPSIGASELQCSFPCFRSAIAEKRAIHTGHLRQPLCQLRLKRVIEQVRGMNQLRCLLSNDLLDRRM